MKRANLFLMLGAIAVAIAGYAVLVSASAAFYSQAGLALLLTVLIETMIAVIFLKRPVWIESTLIQFTTWPLAMVMIHLTNWLWPVELGVAVSETILWFLVLPITIRQAALVSFAGNAATSILGWMILVLLAPWR